MEQSLTVEFYNKIMDSETEGEVVMYNLEIRTAVLDGEIVDEKDKAVDLRLLARRRQAKLQD